MRKEFYVFRHGETDYNKIGKTQGCGIDEPLNATGIAQAHILADELQDKNIEVIYSSNLQRAQKTAEIVAAQADCPVKIIADLREGNYGEAEGMKKDEMQKCFGEVFKQWYDDKHNFMDVRFPKGESRREMGMRMMNVFKALLQTPYQTMGIASHGGSLKSLWFCLGFEIPSMPNCCCLHLVYEDGKWFFC